MWEITPTSLFYTPEHQAMGIPLPPPLGREDKEPEPEPMKYEFPGELLGYFIENGLTITLCEQAVLVFHPGIGIVGVGQTPEQAVSNWYRCAQRLNSL